MENTAALQPTRQAPICSWRRRVFGCAHKVEPGFDHSVGIERQTLDAPPSAVSRGRDDATALAADADILAGLAAGRTARATSRTTTTVIEAVNYALSHGDGVSTRDLTEALMRRVGIPHHDATSKSVEELATTRLHDAKLARRVY
jgi:hypothetical protein